GRSKKKHTSYGSGISHIASWDLNNLCKICFTKYLSEIYQIEIFGKVLKNHMGLGLPFFSLKMFLTFAYK
ncbi:hypothetical protein, partial [Salmonella sp. s51090]|uniref:hypothetical protein n=1 Tax=Salmonella sp. s51090 TaxID=3159651 RepID=UPI00397FE559